MARLWLATWALSGALTSQCDALQGGVDGAAAMQIALEENDLIDGECRAIDRGLSVDGRKAPISNASQGEMCPKATPLKLSAATLDLPWGR